MKQFCMNAALLLLLITCSVSCKQKKGISENDFYGKWSYEEHLNFEQLKKLPGFKEGMDGFADAEMHMKGTTTYRNDEHCSTIAEMTLTITAEGGVKVPMKFNFIERGKWKVQDSILIEKTESSEASPADSLTRAITSAEPSILKELSTAGEISRDRIETVSASLIVLYDRVMGMRMEMRRQSKDY